MKMIKGKYPIIITVTTVEPSEIDFEIPILGKQEYLCCKSNNFGWFVSDQYVLPFLLDKIFIFTRLIFTTEPIGHMDNMDNLTLESEKLFLDRIIGFVKENALCDFIYKAQSNVVFKVCPKESECVPWGTYEVDLMKTDEELFRSFQGKSRNIIRKAIKEGVKTEITKDIDLVYQNIRETLERQNSIHYPSYDYIEKLHKNVSENSLFLIASKDNVVQGSVIVLYDSKRGYAMYAGSIHAPQTGSLDLLHYEAMKYLQTKGITVYDFVGVRINVSKDSKQERLQRFKKKFNPHLNQGYAFRTIINPVKFKLFKLISKVYLTLKGYSYVDPIEQIQRETI